MDEDDTAGADDAMSADAGTASGGLESAAAAAELIRALAVFVEPPAAEHERVAEALGLGVPPDGEAFARLFSFQVYPYASVHLGPEGMMGGEAADRVAGFWQAVGHTPPPEPDHLSALMGLYAALLGHGDGDDSEADVAPEDGDTPHDGTATAQASLLERGRAALLHEHLAPWVFAFLDRVKVLGSPFHGEWATLLDQALAAEVRRGPPIEGLPLHLREAPDLPDPRVDGMGDFLSGILAPVRSGMVLARADLTRIGRSLEIGIRIGERRYILEHLLGQAPAETLAALSDEAEAWARRHETRVELLGDTGDFWVQRARASASLLGDLAREGRELLSEEGTP